MEREGERMVEKFDLDKQDKMLGFSMDRAAAAQAEIDNAKARMDQFVTGAVTGGLSAGIGLLGKDK